MPWSWCCPSYTAFPPISGWKQGRLKSQETYYDYQPFKRSKRKFMFLPCDNCRVWFYEPYVWKRATHPIQNLPDPVKCGWIKDGNVLRPWLLMTESVPENCLKLVTCQCRHGCTLRCGYANHKMPCIPSCHCGGDCHNQAHYTLDNNNFYFSITVKTINTRYIPETILYYILENFQCIFIYFLCSIYLWL